MSREIPSKGLGFEWEFQGSAGGLVRDLGCPPPGQRRPLVSTCLTEQVAVSVWGRLHYVADHLAKLPDQRASATPSALSQSPAEIVAVGYAASGAPWLSRLEGDFCCVVWDRLRRTLVLQRDPLGGYPLFWGRSGSRLIVATSLSVVCHKLSFSELNPEYLAEFLAPGPLQQELNTPECVWRGARRVRPGEQWTLALDTRDDVCTSSWNWVDHLVAPRGATLAEIAAEFRARLDSAVRERLRGKTIVQVSGGLDSTGIAAVARQFVSEAGGLEGVALVFERHRRLAEERKYVDVAAASLRPISVLTIPADELLNFSGLLMPPRHEEPYQGLWQIEAERVLIDHAARRGAEAVLTGLGGDELADNTPFELVDLLRSGRLCTAWRRAAEVASVWGESPWNVLGPYGLRVACDLTLSRHSRRWRAGAVPFGGLPEWIRPEAVRRWHLDERAWHAYRRVYGQGQSTFLSVGLSGVQNRAGNFGRAALAARSGIELGHPLLDPRVVALGLGVRQLVEMPAGVSKPLLRQVFGELLPATIVRRPAKGNFDELYYRGLAAHREQLKHLVIRVSPRLDQWVDSRGLADAVERVALGGLKADQLRVFDSTLSLMGWLNCGMS
jgi:asparagine synthase (glutamine-hydrolysing)